MDESKLVPLVTEALKVRVGFARIRCFHNLRSIPTNIFIIAFFLDPSRSQRDEDAVAWSWMYTGKSLLPKSCVTEHFHVGSIDPPQRKIKRE